MSHRNPSTWVSSTLVGLALLACAEPARVDSTNPGCTSSTGATLASEGDAEPKVITFYGDILPILSSNAADSTYKCTTCHAHYSKPKGMNNVPELERVVESMRSGRMPRGGDPVPADKIELFTMWRLQGFQEGTQKAASSTASKAESNAGKSTSSSNCQ